MTICTHTNKYTHTSIQISFTITSILYLKCNLYILNYFYLKAILVIFKENNSQPDTLLFKPQARSYDLASKCEVIKMHSA